MKYTGGATLGLKECLRDAVAILKTASSAIDAELLGMEKEYAHWVGGCMMQGRHDLRFSVSYMS